MRVVIPVAQYHLGNTSDYVVRAFEALGHSATIIPATEVTRAFNDRSIDLFFCVDSGEPCAALLSLPTSGWQHLAFWFIDFRHNKLRPERNPNDLTVARLIQERGGMIFQAQEEDYNECQRLGISRCAWLPLAADPVVWSDVPEEAKRFDVGFVGNVWDEARLGALQAIQRSGLRLGFAGPGKAWQENAAQILRASRIGFNINSFYGTSICYDLNMRFFETLSCGVPLVTNSVPTLASFVGVQPFVRTYDTANAILTTLKAALNDVEFLNSGTQARKWIEENHTYTHRIRDALKYMSY